MIKKKITPIQKMRVESALAAVMRERGMKADELVLRCKLVGYNVTRTTVYNLCKPTAVGLQFKSLAAICAGLELTPGDLIKLAPVDQVK